MSDKKLSNSSISGLVFVGCMFIGAGIGMMFDQMKIGGAIGMGVGFLAMAMVMFRNKNS